MSVPLRYALFGLLEQLAQWRQGSQNPAAQPASGATGERSLWVFVSTIGELNAIEPFLLLLLQAMGQPPLTLISDRTNYRDAYLRKFPQAQVERIDGSMAQARALTRRRPPALFVVAEIPCTLHDAPCRLSFSTVHQARRAGAAVVLVNGWLYGQQPPSRMDAIENRWFHADYLRQFALMTVQTPAIRERLCAAGMAPERVRVVGNMKFDALSLTNGAGAASDLGRAIEAQARGPVIVVGSVSELAEQRALLQGFEAVLAAHPGAMMVLAPRHPEKPERMQALRALAAGFPFQTRFRSQHAPADAVQTQLLVLDTIGELRGCYATATIAFVGNDHNVLEPLAFGKPVFVGPGWETAFPSYPVYQQLIERQVLHPVPALEALGPAWLRFLEAPAVHASASRERFEAVLASARGASEATMQALREFGLLPQHAGTAAAAA